jgi:hypothetical protein
VSKNRTKIKTKKPERSYCFGNFDYRKKKQTVLPMVINPKKNLQAICAEAPPISRIPTVAGRPLLVTNSEE